MQNKVAYRQKALKKPQRNRIWELDFFRGLAILLVLVDHAMYDLAYMYSSWATSSSSFLQSLHSYGMDYMNSDIRFFWRPAFLFVFFATSGLCTAFSRNNFFRGLKLLAVAVAVSIITYYLEKYADMDAFILFGVLHCLAIIILIYSIVSLAITATAKLISKLNKISYNEKITKYIASAIYLALSIVFLIINIKYNVTLKDVNLNYATIQTDSNILGMLFFVDSWWYADYFPLFPFIAFFFFGAAFSHILYPNKKSLMPSLDGKWHKFFTIPGRYSLIVYLSIQIVAIAFFSLLFAIFG